MKYLALFKWRVFQKLKESGFIVRLQVSIIAADPAAGIEIHDTVIQDLHAVLFTCLHSGRD